MQLDTLRSRGAGTRAIGALVTAAVVALAACSGGIDGLAPGPNIPNDPLPNPQFKQAAFLFNVNTSKGTVAVTAPTKSVSTSLAKLGKANGLNLSSGKGPTPSFSLLGGDVLDITASNYHASGVGQGGASPGKVLVTFDISVTNKLSGAQLARAAAFPVVPGTASDNFIFAFPFKNVLVPRAGGATGSGNTILIDLPNTGLVDASGDWNGNGGSLNGNSWNFFNDNDCAAVGANDCFRYEAFGAPLGPLATTASQTVGFQIDPTVSEFTSFVLLAADVANSGPAVSGTVRARISSPQRGVLSGVTGTINPGGFTGTSDGTAAPGFNLVIPNVNAGPARTLALSGLPAGCTAPAPVTVPAISAAGNIDLADISVTCSAFTGTVSGSINVTLAGGLATAPSLAGASVTVTPAGAGLSPVTINPSAAGAFSSANVGYSAPSGSGAVSVTGIPAGCTPTSFTGATAASYSGLTNVAPQTVSFLVTCSPPPAFYQLRATFGPVSGGKVTVTWSVDMSTRNDPTDPLADKVNALQFNTTYDVSKVTISDPTQDPTSTADGTGCTPASGWTIAQAGNGGAPSGVVAWGLVSSAGRTNAAGGSVPIGSCVFNAPGHGATAASFDPASYVMTIVGPSGNINTAAFIQGNDGTTTLP